MNRTNLLVLAASWSASAYSYYFVEFYMKLVPFQNLYGLAVLIGLSDLTGTYLYYYLVTCDLKLNQTTIQKTSFGFMCLFSGTLFICLSISGDDEESLWYGLLIFLIRLTSNVALNLSYLQSAKDFPTGVTGLAFTITNAFCRFTTLFAPLVAETVPNPSFTISLLCLAAGLL